MDGPGGSDPPPPPPKVEASIASVSSNPVEEDPSSKMPPLADGAPINAKRRRNKRGGNKASARSGNRAKRGGTSSSLQLPQLKITIRNIGDVDRHGTSAKLLDMVRSLIEAVNADVLENGGIPILLDEDSVYRIVHAEELAAATAATESTEQEAIKEESEAMQTVVENDAEQSESVKDEDSKPEGSKEGETHSGPGYAAVAAGSERSVKSEDPNVVSARVLYAVPPKRSRRRGQKNGCAYLVLSPPRPLPDTSPTEPEPIMSPAERSRAVAKARLMLFQTLDSISQKAQSDSRGGQVFGGCIVEQSMNVKTWKDRERNHRDRREGTVQQMADYRRFMANTEEAEQDRLNRPRPAPGGGATTTGADATNESGQPVAALVLHLRAKRDAQKAKRRKGASGKKKSDAKDKNTRKKKREPSKKSKNSGRRENDKSRKKKGAKKGPPPTATAAPTLLKHTNGVPDKAKPVGLTNGTG